MHASVELAGGELAAVVTRTASKALATPDANNGRPPWQKIGRIGRAKYSDKTRSAQSGQMQRTRIMRNNSVACVTEINDLRKGQLAYVV